MSENKLTDALMFITDRPDLMMVEGHGSWLKDDKGKTYLDFVQGWAVNCLGHSPEILVKAIAAQAAKLINCSPAFFNTPMAELADLIGRHSTLDKVFFANSGAEANEGAVKLARKWGQLHRNGAHEIITMHSGFHGRTLATMSASGKPQWDNLYEPKVPGFIKVPFNDLEVVRSAVSDLTVAVMLEPIQGEAGVIPATTDYLQGLKQLTTELGILLILDEVQTGIGRTGTLFAYEQAQIIPDILTLGKGLGGGVPLAALVARGGVCCFAPGDQGGTFNGNPLMCAAGVAIMREVAQPSFLARVTALGDYLQRSLEALSDKHHLGEVRGKGLLLALDLGRDISNRIVEEAMTQGLLLNAPRSNLLRFMPALNVMPEEIDQMASMLDRILCQF